MHGDVNVIQLMWYSPFSAVAPYEKRSVLSSTDYKDMSGGRGIRCVGSCEEM